MKIKTALGNFPGLPGTKGDFQFSRFECSKQTGSSLVILFISYMRTTSSLFCSHNCVTQFDPLLIFKTWPQMFLGCFKRSNLSSPNKYVEALRIVLSSEGNFKNFPSFLPLRSSLPLTFSYLGHYVKVYSTSGRYDRLFP